jgi:hypothetical protein
LMNVILSNEFLMIKSEFDRNIIQKVAFIEFIRQIHKAFSEYAQAFDKIKEIQPICNQKDIMFTL